MTYSTRGCPTHCSIRPTHCYTACFTLAGGTQYCDVRVAEFALEITPEVVLIGDYGAWTGCQQIGQMWRAGEDVVQGMSLVGFGPERAQPTGSP